MCDFLQYTLKNNLEWQQITIFEKEKYESHIRIIAEPSVSG